MTYDICIIGSGAGAGPIAYELSRAGKKVVILEKGDIYSEKDFSKDEIAYTKRDIFTPKLKEQYHTIEAYEEGKWVKTPTYESGWSFWNGSLLGGSSNFMSGFFHRLKPDDFRLKSVYGEFEGANVEDWPISYDELEPFYDLVEKVVGVSGKVTPYAHQEKRSSPEYPYPPLAEHPIVEHFDATCKALDFTPFKTPRAIISESKEGRNPCYYSNYCGSYACSSGAKGSSRATLIQPALATHNLHIIANAFVVKLLTDETKNIKSALYLTKEGTQKSVEAKLFVLAAQAVESSRLLLNSKNKEFPDGLANSSGAVGKNMLFTGGGMGSGEFDLSHFSQETLLQSGLFVNRALKDWYFTKEFKGGVVDFLFEHPNPIRRANSLKREDGKLLFGKALQDKIFQTFTTTRTLSFEVFTDWMPNDNCFVSVDENYQDKYGIPVANIRIGAHPQDVKVGEFLAQKALKVLEKMEAKNITYDISPLPSQNLQAGGCRFGDDPKKHVLNRYCQSYDHPN
ncbi:MAG: GMC family oxidoreductase, partial [Sulfurospirillum sp.]|nr:GMC family oxidoreductase [Sulfurospirillum sp.]